MPAEYVVGVLLAAGAGRRLGLGPKALLTLAGAPDDGPQVVRMVNALWRGGCDEVVVVVGADGAHVRRVLGPGRHRVVVNEAWETGMGSSFRAGVDAADDLLTGRPDGSVMVALADQPDVDAGVVSYLRAVASQRRVTAAGFPDPHGRLIRGHPIVFPVAMAREAAATAEGDAGGRAWLRAHPTLVEVVDTGHLATGRDVDTPADLHRWLNETGVADDTA
ncbi:nucleotidyltransferase family protein [Corynebacterium halotolerans]|uniref:MobA-like NTP transferase domain-containing protein n=1 Tax=Corynebacterium halotolerans YIM 70093 = DSM 44683 TaxID=1121362 RepID=M1NNT1_9CORY|nr:NTP transferase domain-containing protein [Corynebacterium halotolerans]AGF72978.1 hypothetical protein A605_09880 [Corynebacterium halotolerans YIM 70093 = DSM 44683]